MTVRESTLLALKAMNRWANYKEVFAFMKENGYFVGNSKTPDKTVGSELYKYGESGIIEKRKISNIPDYKVKE